MRNRCPTPVQPLHQRLEQPRGVPILHAVKKEQPHGSRIIAIGRGCKPFCCHCHALWRVCPIKIPCQTRNLDVWLGLTSAGPLRGSQSHRIGVRQRARIQ